MDTREPANRPRSSARPTWLIVVAVVVTVAVLGAAALLLSSGPSESEYPSDSPQAAFQDYVRAWESGDANGAWAFLSTAARERVSYERFEAANRRQPDDAYRVWIEDVSVDGDQAALQVVVESLTGNGLLEPDRERLERRVTLVREAGTWKVENPTVSYSW
jgi:hypothetical protein